MNYLKFTAYIYLVFAAYFVYDGISKWNNGTDGSWLSLIIAGSAIFMFFFRQRFSKKFEDRNNKS
ncbi:hypothetical protein [Flavobacterium restrictum]|uniref:Uncharacterized protein n=1 Tax=Flavobacterium restrictum TaxID=2594428 RepID=A0A553DU97_9FLAO|nr:hypothetical protein [Flavobacterium restrictum]TRX36322.1 hypothetical protein FNW21_13515 [Flavobacterium restrictum]